jgi:hypothetical protein
MAWVPRPTCSLARVRVGKCALGFSTVLTRASQRKSPGGKLERANGMLRNLRCHEVVLFVHSRARLCSGQNGTLPVMRVTTQRQRPMARFYSCAQAQADGLTTTAVLATSRERNATTTIRVRHDEAQGSKARSCPFLGFHTCGHKVNLDRDTTAGRRAVVRSRRDRERSMVTTQCGVGMTIGTTRGDSQAGRAHAVDGSGTCRRKARLDGRHTSVGGLAVAAVRFNQIKSTTSWARPDFSLSSKAGIHSTVKGR